MSDLKSLIKGKRNIIWDWNGTVLNDVDHAVVTMNKTLTQRNLDPIDKEVYRHKFTFPIRDYYLALGIDLEKYDFAALCDEFVDNYLEGLSTCGVFKSTLEQLSQFQSMGLNQSVLSAADQKSLDIMVDTFKVRDFFQEVYGVADRFAHSKVGRGHELIAQTSYKPQETLLFGDTLHDLEVGEALGCEVILVAHGHQNYERLSGSYDKVIKGF